LWEATAPVAGLSLLVASMAMAAIRRGLAWYEIPIVVFAVAVLAFTGHTWWLERAVEKRVSPEITARYRQLWELLDLHRDAAVLRPPDAPMALLPSVIPPDPDTVKRFGWREWREWRRISDEDILAMRERPDTMIVWELFILETDRPLVTHRLHPQRAGGHQDNQPPLPAERDLEIPRTWWGRHRMVTRSLRLTGQTGVDLATVAELDELIAQIRSATNPAIFPADGGAPE
jgi:hypothetical protein